MASRTSPIPCCCGHRSRSPSAAAKSNRCSDAARRCKTVAVNEELRARVEQHIREHDLIAPRGEVVALVSGGADSTCLWHALGALGYRVSAVHVDYGLRGDESEADASFCANALQATVIRPSNR